MLRPNGCKVGFAIATEHEANAAVHAAGFDLGGVEILQHVEVEVPIAIDIGEF